MSVVPPVTRLARTVSADRVQAELRYREDTTRDDEHRHDNPEDESSHGAFLPSILSEPLEFPQAQHDAAPTAADLVNLQLMPILWSGNNSRSSGVDRCAPVAESAAFAGFPDGQRIAQQSGMPGSR